MNDLPRKANPGKFLVVGAHTDGDGERVFLWWNLDAPECALRYAKLLSDDDRTQGHESEYGVYDDRGNRLDISPLEGVCHFHSETGTEGGLWSFQDSRFISPGGSWSYEGLHVLCDGDHLTIFSPDNPQQVVWSGTISLREHPLFAEHTSGFWIHADQDGVARDTWAEYFFKNYPAKLVPAPEPKK